MHSSPSRSLANSCDWPTNFWNCRTIACQPRKILSRAMTPLSSLRRLTDYAQLAAGATCARFAFSTAAQSRAQRHVAERLGRMRGLPQKMGQLLSLCEMEQEAAASYANLQDSAEPLP